MRYYERGFQILLDKKQRDQLWHQSKFALVSRKEKKRRDKKSLVESCADQSYSDFDGKADPSDGGMFTLKGAEGHDTGV